MIVGPKNGAVRGALRVHGDLAEALTTLADDLRHLDRLQDALAAVEEAIGYDHAAPRHEPHPPPLVPHVQLKQPCSAHVPHERTTCFFSASRARNTRTAAFPRVIPTSAA